MKGKDASAGVLSVGGCTVGSWQSWQLYEYHARHRPAQRGSPSDAVARLQCVASDSREVPQPNCCSRLPQAITALEPGCSAGSLAEVGSGGGLLCYQKGGLPSLRLSVRSVAPILIQGQPGSSPQLLVTSLKAHCQAQYGDEWKKLYMVRRVDRNKSYASFIFVDLFQVTDFRKKKKSTVD